MADVFARGGLVIGMGHRRIFIQDWELELSRREFDLFCLLASSPGRVFTYEQLLRQVWDGGYAFTTNSAHSCIRKIRKEAGEYPGLFMLH